MVRASDLWSRGHEFDSWATALPGSLGQLSLPSLRVGKYSTHVRYGIKAGRTHLRRIAGNTVWSHMAGDVPCSRWPKVSNQAAKYGDMWKKMPASRQFLLQFRINLGHFWSLVFSARQHAERAICYRPSVRPSVCHTGGSVKNGWTYHRNSFTIW